MAVAGLVWLGLFRSRIQPLKFLSISSSDKDARDIFEDGEDLALYTYPRWYRIAPFCPINPVERARGSNPQYSVAVLINGRDQGTGQVAVPVRKIFEGWPFFRK